MPGFAVSVRCMLMVMVIVMIMCLFLGFAIESTGTQMLQEAGVALLIG